MPTISVAHEEIYYARHGDSGVPLLCLHGAGGTHAAWLNAVKLLDRVAAVLPDLPAHGQSTGQGRSTVAAYAGVVSALLDALQLPAGSGPQARTPTKSSEQVAAAAPSRPDGMPGAESHGPADSGHQARGAVPGAEGHGPAGSGHQARGAAVPGAESHGPQVVLAGHSMGGAIALWLALHQPQRVRALVLAGTGAKLRVHPDILQAAKEGRPIGAPSARPANAAPEVVYGDWLACDTFDVMSRLGEIHVPTLVLVGSQDIMTPAKYAGFLAKSIPGATLVTIEGAGHSAMVDKPAEVAAAVQTFIDSLPPVG